MKNKLIAITTMLSRMEITMFGTPFTNSPIISGDDEKAIVGIVAKGNCNAITALR